MKTFEDLGPDGFPFPRSFINDFEAAERLPLWIDSRGFRTDISPANVIVNAAGADFNVYHRESTGANFGLIEFVSHHLRTKKKTSCSGTRGTSPGQRRPGGAR